MHPVLGLAPDRGIGAVDHVGRYFLSPASRQAVEEMCVRCPVHQVGIDPVGREDLAAFTNDLHGYLMSDGKVKPLFAEVKGPPRAAAAGAAPSTTTADNPGGRHPLRTGATQTGAETEA